MSFDSGVNCLVIFSQVSGLVFARLTVTARPRRSSALLASLSLTTERSLTDSAGSAVTPLNCILVDE